MYNNTNPAELYNGTTWELLPNDKFIKTGATPLQQNGSNSVSISKANLPADKLQVESFSLTRGTMDITGGITSNSKKDNQFLGEIGTTSHGAFALTNTSKVTFGDGMNTVQSPNSFDFKASRAWTGSTSSASPYTTAMGDGTPITVNPEHITVKAWKRLS